MFHVIGALAEIERSLISERAKAGMEAVKTRDLIERPKSLAAAQIAHARELLASGDSAAFVPRWFGVTRPTIHRALQNRGRSPTAERERAHG